ncbi:MAG: bifunctional adenosylcobinamide kinase/adenosylcobinamide-phosphate guanylyltransferase [Defluviitaleaceae bacterium]|nr:bifunctional adenosylcobinamide kinase/adenosylcobinamide-phosphate guanylyltransferase [Defluviitaleaceae bacterium]
MILIFGGAYQGKLEYAIKRFGLLEADVIFCKDEDATCPTGSKAVYQIDKWILALICEGKNIKEETERFLNKSPNTIIICNDISCGVVPIDPVLRKWREETGRFLGLLAQHSSEVIRLYCGIPTTLKGA